MNYDDPSKKRRRLGRAPVFAVTSGKAGVGKTNLVANFALALRQRQKRVLAIDAASGPASLDLFFQTHAELSLADFFAGRVGLDELIVTNRDDILLLPGAPRADALARLSDGQKLVFLAELDALSHELDLVLVDTASGPADGITYFASAAQEIVVVVTPEPSALAESYALMESLARSRREKRFRVIINQAADHAQARHLFAMLSASTLRFLNASMDFFGWIPQDPALAQAAAQQQAVIQSASQSPAAQAIVGLAERLVMTAAGSKIKGNVQFFLRRMLEDARAEL